MALAIRSGIPADVWRNGPEGDLETAIQMLADEAAEVAKHRR